jgi:hypothetical protein
MLPKIPHCALILLALSQWQKLLASQNDQSFITMMGLTVSPLKGSLRSLALCFQATCLSTHPG